MLRRGAAKAVDHAVVVGAASSSQRRLVGSILADLKAMHVERELLRYAVIDIDEPHSAGRDDVHEQVARSANVPRHFWWQDREHADRRQPDNRGLCSRLEPSDHRRGSVR